MKRLGVRLQFVRLNKALLLKVSFEEAAGGNPTLKALKRYLARLAKKHGVPTYAGKTPFKGEVRERFRGMSMSQGANEAL